MSKSTLWTFVFKCKLRLTGKKEYRKKLEESLEWNEKDEQRSKGIWGDKKEVPLEVEP